MENGGNDSGVWEYTPIESSKDYYVSQTDYDGAFGIKDVLSPTGSGTDRFYVMALSDFDSDYHYWYYSASGSLDSTYNVSTSANDFGEGKANTTRMIEAWTNRTYGSQNGGSSYTDLWGIIQTEYSNGWFVPSKSEWSAFGDAFEIMSNNYGNFGLRFYYWASSQYTTDNTYCAFFLGGCIGTTNVGSNYYVRLGTTF